MEVYEDVGKVTPLKQFDPFIIEFIFKAGKPVIEEQPCHVDKNVWTEDVFIFPKLVIEEQPLQVFEKLIAELVFITGN